MECLMADPVGLPDLSRANGVDVDGNKKKRVNSIHPLFAPFQLLFRLGWTGTGFFLGLIWGVLFVVLRGKTT